MLQSEFKNKVKAIVEENFGTQRELHLGCIL
jgi:hypothetical protein